MTVYIGVDFHARQQTTSYLTTEDGEIQRAGPSPTAKTTPSFPSLDWASLLMRCMAKHRKRRNGRNWRARFLIACS